MTEKRKCRFCGIHWGVRSCILIVALYLLRLVYFCLAGGFSPDVAVEIVPRIVHQNYENCTNHANFPVVLVLGMHHTATSLVSHGLIYMGLYAGETKDILLANPAVSIQNNSKFFEQKLIVEYNDKIYTDLASGSNYRQLPSFPKWLGAGIDIGNTQQSERDSMVRGAVPVINYFCNEDTFRLHRGIVLKDPRMPVTLPIWLPALSNFNVACVITYRGPYQVYASLVKWVPPGLDSFHAVISVWEATYRNSLQYCDKQTRIVILQEDLFDNIENEFNTLRSSFIKQKFVCLDPPSNEFLSKSKSTSRVDYVLPKPRLSPSQYRITSSFTGFPSMESVDYFGSFVVFCCESSSSSSSCNLNNLDKITVESILSHYPFSSVHIVVASSSISESFSDNVNLLKHLGYDVTIETPNMIMARIRILNYDACPQLLKLASIIFYSSTTTSMTLLSSGSMLIKPFQTDVPFIETHTDLPLSFHIPSHLVESFSVEFLAFIAKYEPKCSALNADSDIRNGVLEIFQRIPTLSHSSLWNHDCPIEIQAVAFNGDEKSQKMLSNSFKSNGSYSFVHLNYILFSQRTTKESLSSWISDLDNYCISCRDDKLSSFGKQYKDTIDSLLPNSTYGNVKLTNSEKLVIPSRWIISMIQWPVAAWHSHDTKTSQSSSFGFVQVTDLSRKDQANLLEILKGLDGSMQEILIMSDSPFDIKMLGSSVCNYLRDHSKINVRLFLVDGINDIVSGTPFEGLSLVEFGQAGRTIPIHRLTREILAYSLIWKLGGLYIEDFSEFGATRVDKMFISESDKYLSSIYFPSHHPAVLLAMRACAKAIDVGYDIGAEKVSWMSDAILKMQLNNLERKGNNKDIRLDRKILNKLTFSVFESPSSSNDALEPYFDLLRDFPGSSFASVSLNDGSKVPHREKVKFPVDLSNAAGRGYKISSAGQSRLKILIDYGTVTEYILLLATGSEIVDIDGLIQLISLLDNDNQFDLISLSSEPDNLWTYGSSASYCYCAVPRLHVDDSPISRIHVAFRSSGILIRASLLEAVVTGKDPKNPYLIDGESIWLQNIFYRASLVGAHVASYQKPLIVASPSLFWSVAVQKDRICNKGVKNLCPLVGPLRISQEIPQYNTILNLRQTVKPSKTFKLAAVTVILNEGMFLKEWIDYHVHQGFDSFVFYDDGSDDGFQSILSSYTVCYDVNCSNLRNSPRPVIFIENVSDRGLKQTLNGQILTQTNCFADALQKYGKLMNWMAFIDVDEFIASIDDAGKFGDYIENVVDDFVGGVMLRTVLFGSNSVSRKLEPNDLVTELFTRRFDWNAMNLPNNADFLRFRQGKSVVRPSVVSPSSNAHEFQYHVGWQAVDDDLHIQWSISVISKPTKFYLAHFKCKSSAHYKDKMGKSVVQGNANKWGWYANTFEGADRNDIEDNTLRNFRRNFEEH